MNWRTIIYKYFKTKSLNTLIKRLILIRKHLKPNIFSWVVFCFFSIHIAHATVEQYPIGSERAKQVAELFITLYAQAPHDPTWLNIQFGAALAGISVDQASKLNVISSPTSMIENTLSAPYTKKELVKVEPVIEKQMMIQSSITDSCKLSGKMTRPTASSYEFPVSCQIPIIDWSSLQKPVPNLKASAEKNFMEMLNWVNEVMLEAPTQNINTIIRLNQDGERLLPDITSVKYFPISLNRAVSGVSEGSGKRRSRLGP